MKKDYEFIAFNGNGKQIELKAKSIFKRITKKNAETISTAIEIGLMQKYKMPIVIFREV